MANTVVIILDVLVLVALVVLGMLARSYLPGYFSQKGRDLATREDVRDITREIEAARLEYARELERLRADLATSSEVRSRVRQTRQEALFAFAEACLELLVGRLPRSLGDFLMDEGKSLFDHQETLLVLCTKIQLAYFRLELLLPLDHPLVLSARKAWDAAPELARAIRKTLPRARMAILTEEEITKSGRDKDDPAWRQAVEGSDAAGREFREAIQAATSQLANAFVEFRGGLQKYLLEADPVTEAESPGGR